jgi:hypothetical protein
MGPDGVVVVTPLLNEYLGFLEAAEDFAVDLPGSFCTKRFDRN